MVMMRDVLMWKIVDGHLCGGTSAVFIRIFNYSSKIVNKLADLASID